MVSTLDLESKNLTLSLGRTFLCNFSKISCKPLFCSVSTNSFPLALTIVKKINCIHYRTTLHVINVIVSRQVLLLSFLDCKSQASNYRARVCI